MVVIGSGDVAGLHPNNLVGVLHCVTLGGHCQHPQVVFVIAKGHDFTGGTSKVVLQKGESVALCPVGVTNQVRIKTGILNDKRCGKKVIQSGRHSCQVDVIGKVDGNLGELLIRIARKDVADV